MMTPMTQREWVLVVLIVAVLAAASIAGMLLIATGHAPPNSRPLTP
jgi:hypothetical protein